MALLIDYHFHTEISEDGETPLYDMVMAEYNAGVRRLCVTDHCDLVDWRTLEFTHRCDHIAERLRAAYDECCRRLPPDMELRLGMELGEANFDLPRAAALAAAPGLDYTLGSHHICRELGDYYWLHYTDIPQCDRIFDIYLTNLQAIAEADFFDAMAHIGYVRRYAFEQGVDAALTLDKFGDRVELLLKTLIRNGRGIEINCSGIRDGCGPFPSAEILHLYRELGGEYITVGSDAHRPEDAAKCLTDGYDILREVGFRYITSWKNHKPEMIRL